MAPLPQPASRYRRRILGIGALATGALYVIGAPIFNDRIERDLEQRVPAELAAIGFDGVSAEFSGQEGVLSCTQPLDDPEGARAAAYDVRGVREIDIERSCRVLTAPTTPEPADASGTTATDTTPTAATDDSEGEDDDAADPDGVDGATTTTAEAGDGSTDADLADIGEVVAADPDLAFLSVLLADTALPDLAGPITLFAPSNEAFDALPSDVVANLQDDAVRRESFIEHHMVAGVVASGDLGAGPLVALDGAELPVTGSDPVVVDGAEIVRADIVASNGIVHVTDSVLLTPALAAGAVASASATLSEAMLTLQGVLASEVERSIVVTAATDGVGETAVVDETSVDPDTGVDAATAGALAQLVAAMSTTLVSGEVGFDGAELYARGVYRTAETRDAFIATATSVGVIPRLEAPPAATDDPPDDPPGDAAGELEDRLNAFVAENPIRFEPASAALDQSALPVIDQIASDVLAVDGIGLTVEGHTDSDGLPARNLVLSQQRANTVRDALVERGVPPASVEAIGVGSERPVLVDGVEDKEASRRVEFRVVTT